MKTIIVKALGLALLITLAGCGKGSSKGGSSVNCAKNPYQQACLVNGGMNGIGTISGTQALANFKAWYASSNNGMYPGSANLYKEDRTTYTYNTGSNCSSQPVKIFGINLGNFQSCSYSSSPTSTNTVTNTVAVLVGASKASNAILASIYAGTAGTLVSAVQTQGLPSYGGALYIIRLQAVDGSVKEYWIDTGINSAFQPVKTVDVTNSKEEVVTWIRL